MQRADDNQELLEELRQRAKRKKARPERLQFITVAITAAICAVALDVSLLLAGVYDVKPKHAGYSGRWGGGGELLLYPFLMWIGFVLLLVYVFKWTGAFRQSIEAAEKFNPDSASLDELLAWLGMELKP